MTLQRILTFHGLGAPQRAIDDDEADVWIPLDWFDAILDTLPDDDTARITFDDGNRSDLELALPSLRRHDRTATFFVLAGKLDVPGYLDRTDLASLTDAGMRVGSHGMDHRRWRGLDRDDLTREVTESRALLAECAGPVDEAACPFGVYDRRVLDALRHAGYDRVYTSDGGDARRDAWLTPRTTVTRRRPLGEWLRWLATPLGPPSLRARARRSVKRWR